jgi:hypothetical protein
MSFIGWTSPNKGQSNNAVVHGVLLFVALVLVLLGCNAVMR